MAFEALVAFGEFAGVFFDLLEHINLNLAVSDLLLQFFNQVLLFLLIWVIAEGVGERKFL